MIMPSALTQHGLNFPLGGKKGQNFYSIWAATTRIQSCFFVAVLLSHIFCPKQAILVKMVNAQL